VYYDRANPTLFEGYGGFLGGTTVHTYTFDADKYFVGLAVRSLENTNGF